ncbi:hypothetical protein H4582DRAFT_2117639 [Lactarius indigo]|nr:hypothetical protein H4582DRAFT_2117639 [Lactarius indigo]
MVPLMWAMFESNLNYRQRNVALKSCEIPLFLALSESSHTPEPKVLHSIENGDLHAIQTFGANGWRVDHHVKVMNEDSLVQRRSQYRAIGIRKTKITERVIKAASMLLVIRCFCIGVNQADLVTAGKAGTPVFNSPFSNSRSVAELVLSETIALVRQVIWNKQSKGCWEIRGKTLGIIGYGHIGSQLSVLAEVFGLCVLFYDVVNFMLLGSVRQVESLFSLLSESDFVTIHVPELPNTMNMIPKGSHIVSAAIDVFPHEPGVNGTPFGELRALKNIVLTPHIRSSTEEAQRTIGQAHHPLAISILPNHVRICHVHINQPVVLRQVNEVLSPYNAEKKYSGSKGDVTYLTADIADRLREMISKTSANILTRLLA